MSVHLSYPLSGCRVFHFTGLLYLFPFDGHLQFQFLQF